MPHHPLIENTQMDMHVSMKYPCRIIYLLKIHKWICMYLGNIHYHGYPFGYLSECIFRHGYYHGHCMDTGNGSRLGMGCFLSLNNALRWLLAILDVKNYDAPYATIFNTEPWREATFVKLFVEMPCLMLKYSNLNQSTKRTVSQATWVHVLSC